MPSRPKQASSRGRSSARRAKKQDQTASTHQIDSASLETPKNLSRKVVVRRKPADAKATKRLTTTLMIYLAGDNNLSEECIFALTELKRANASSRLQIFAQYDPGDEFLPTQRYHINRYGSGRSEGPIAEDLIDQFPFSKESRKKLAIRAPYGERRERKGEGGTGDPKMLFNFVAFCVDCQERKTDQYILIICGHGGGVQRDFLLRDNRPDGYLTIYELRTALRAMKERLKDKYKRPLKLDLFGMDVCLMSMAEVAYELRQYIDIAVGCESYSPAAGWPYRETVRKIEKVSEGRVERFDEDAWKSVTDAIVKEYVKFYSDYWLGGLSVTMSAIDVSRVEELSGYVQALAGLMIDELREEMDRNKSFDLLSEDKKARDDSDRGYDHTSHGSNNYGPSVSFSEALTLAHWKTQSYNGELYVDLADFCDCLAPLAPARIRILCRHLSNFIKKDFTLISCSWGRHYQYSHGVSIYFPWQFLMPYYGASIDFPGDSRWLQFLKTYLAATRRPPRWYPMAPLEAKREDLKILQKSFSDVRMGSDKMGSDKMGCDEGGNPIHSMRNPPIVFIPSYCLEPNIRHENAQAQYRLMREVELRELLPNPKDREREENTAAATLLLGYDESGPMPESEANDENER